MHFTEDDLRVPAASSVGLSGVVFGGGSAVAGDGPGSVGDAFD